MLVAETWPARSRGLVLSANRSAWSVGAASGVAVLGAHQDRKKRIRDRKSTAGFALDEDDRQWFAKAEHRLATAISAGPRRPGDGDDRCKPGTRLVQHRRHVDAAVPVTATWLVDRRIRELYIWWALCATTGFWGMVDGFGRRRGIAIHLTEAAVFLTIWIFAESKLALWVWAMAWSWGFIGVWGPVPAYTAEKYPTRIRGVGDGFSWGVAFLVGAVLWPFVSVYPRETTGSFVAAFR